MHSFKYALLASSVLTMITVGASAGTFIEGTTTPTPFPNAPPGPNIDFSTFQTVQGTLQGGIDPDDVFTFTGLTAGDDFSINFTRAGPLGSGSSFVFTADGFMETLGPFSSKTDSGVLGGTSLAVGVKDNFTGPGIGALAEGYSVTLSEIPAGVPEPSAVAMFAVGLAGLAVARRKRSH
jgi:hypothetical protein